MIDSSNYKLTRHFILLIIILLTSNCTNRKKFEEIEIVYVKEPTYNCIEFLHPEWVDDGITYIDHQGRWYGIRLKAYVKNACDDTIRLALDRHGLLHIGFESFFLKLESISVGGSVHMITKSYLNIPPGDSIYLGITEYNLYRIDMLDSIKVNVSYRKNKIDINELFTIRQPLDWFPTPTNQSIFQQPTTFPILRLPKKR